MVKMLRKILASIVVVVVCLGMLGGFTVPGNQDEGTTVTVYNPDGRMLDLGQEEAEEYVKDGWSTNFNDVAVTLWKTDGSSTVALKSRAGELKSSGWSTKEAVTVIMEDPQGNQQDVFKDDVNSKKQEGWKAVGTHADPSKPAIALTFDDGPNTATTSRLLDILEKYDVKATFFMLGNRVSGGKECVKRMQELGMEIGSHTYDHSELTKLSADALASQINKTNQAVKDIIGEDPSVMRPPYGAYNNSVKAAAGMPLVLWSVDTLDWKTRNAASVADVVMSQTRDGSILLFHDIYDSSVDAIEKVVPKLQAKGYQLVTVSELAELKGKPMENGGVYTNF